MAINVRLKNNAGAILHPQTSAGLVTGLTQFVSGVISSGGLLKRKVVDALPAGNDINVYTIYMVPKGSTGAERNVYNEYIYIKGEQVGEQEGKWELIGDTAVSLEGYATQTWVGENFVSNSTFEVELGKKADKATTLEGYGITDAVSDSTFVTELGKKADKADTLAGYGITDAVSDSTFVAALGGKADKATSLEGYGITDAVSDAQLEAYKGEVTAALDDKVSDSAFDAYKEQVAGTINGINNTISGLISFEVISDSSESSENGTV